MTQAKFSTCASQPTRWADGALFLGLAMMSGLAGGALAFLLPHNEAVPIDVSAALRHGFLLDFFVIPIALLGGLGRWLIPVRFGIASMATPRLDALCLAFLTVGAIVLTMGDRIGPQGMLAALLLWSIGIFGVATGTIITVLEDRPGRFRDLSLFVWSQFAAALTVLLTTPIFAAFVVEASIGSDLKFAALTSIPRVIRLPLVAMSATLALGVAGEVLLRGAKTTPIPAAALFAVMALVGPLLWAHGIIHGVLLGAAQASYLDIAAIGLPSVAIVTLWCWSLWCHKASAGLPLQWSCGALLLLSAGWGFALLPGSRGGLHSAMLFGAIFAVFAGYYDWLEAVEGLRVPRWFGLLHFQLCSVGVVLSLWPATLSHRLGDGLMGLSMLCVFPLAANMLAHRHFAKLKRSA